MAHPHPDWQPALAGKLIRLRPLQEDDFEAVFAAASDPLIWEQHPERERYQRENFERYFRSGIESGGALVVVDQETGKVIGSSRYRDYRPEQSAVEVGYTFLTRACWGNGYNSELKRLMLDHAFQYVQNVVFVVGETNFRSQKAVLKLGALEIARISRFHPDGRKNNAVIFRLAKTDWLAAERAKESDA